MEIVTASYQSQDQFDLVRQKVVARMKEEHAWMDNGEIIDALTQEVVGKLEARKLAEVSEVEKLRAKQAAEIAAHPKQLADLKSRQVVLLEKAETDALKEVTWEAVNREWRKTRPVIEKPVSTEPKPVSAPAKKKTKASSKHTATQAVEQNKAGAPAVTSTVSSVEPKPGISGFNAAAPAAKPATLGAH